MPPGGVLLFATAALGAQQPIPAASITTGFQWDSSITLRYQMPAQISQNIANSYSVLGRSWTFNVIKNDGTNQVWTPSPWDDFDAGDTCTLVIKDDNYDLTQISGTSNFGILPIVEFTVQWDPASGAEQLIDMAIQSVAAFRVSPPPYRNPTSMLLQGRGFTRTLQRTPQ